jgi:hypothetical protein
MCGFFAAAQAAPAFLLLAAHNPTCRPGIPPMHQKVCVETEMGAGGLQWEDEGSVK